MNNKWMKWIVGVGGISAFTLFLQTIDANDQASNVNEDFALNENMNVNVVNATENTGINKDEREQQLLALDWDESNWDVEYSNETIIASPRNGMPYLDRAEERTRRS
ncbi:hypothetical protein M670_01546 [Schinkia azotoformans MEV2011]|uniref:Uncharacterized protein n=1 Tax=Schinkia azotoformans MEV2011 TaxID=1348973 RepID=A0A072NNZ0_SCHAZ|nr:hypothetical protein [Schinkia azotoformans]KEF39156.1 hypothetical protein M670_01546 [Schinkia azotoformans MEV2011]MEC1742047.1 hypothetical protein [Schinkia azotoformans]MEC1766311.1 hypothetical protein [Schinkia azotoformans]MEC1772948.1 hypothetical protein [Schinkia azotoformans]MEC1786509.1 hypothetical protein [Schinkia azotoformans]